MTVNGDERGSRRHRGLRRRWPALVDQVVSSLSNALVFLLVARSFDTTGPVGAFSLAMTAYLLALGAVRALVGEPLLSLYSATEPSVRRRLVADIQSTTVFLGLVGSSVLVVVSALVGGVSGSALLALAVVLPALLFQDSWRYVYIIDRPMVALVIDVVWLVAVVAILPLAPQDAGIGWFVGAWGVGGAAAAALGAVLAGGRTIGLHPFRWLGRHRDIGFRYFGEFVVSRGVFEMALIGLGVVAGLGALGVVRGSLVYYGALHTLYGGIALALIPEGVKLKGQPTRLRQMMTVAAAVMVGATVAWMVVGLLLPDAWGRFGFGPVWEDGKQLLVPMGLAMVARAVVNRSLFGLRSLADARRSMRARLLSAPWDVVCPILGAVVADAPGFAVGFVASQTVTAIVWTTIFRQAIAERSDGDGSAASATSTGSPGTASPDAPDVADLTSAPR